MKHRRHTQVLQSRLLQTELFSNHERKHGDSKCVLCKGRPLPLEDDNLGFEPISNNSVTARRTGMDSAFDPLPAHPPGVYQRDGTVTDFLYRPGSGRWFVAHPKAVRPGRSMEVRPCPQPATKRCSASSSVLHQRRRSGLHRRNRQRRMKGDASNVMPPKLAPDLRRGIESLVKPDPHIVDVDLSFDRDEVNRAQKTLQFPQ